MTRSFAQEDRRLASTRTEMRPLASRFSGRLRCLIPDWPGFGDAGRAKLGFRCCAFKIPLTKELS
jgi:hypothetical protein